MFNRSNKKGRFSAVKKAGIALAAALSVSMSAPASSQQLYSFGDSLSDTGNLLGPAGSAENLLGIFGADFSTFNIDMSARNYFHGRFSNGYNWVDHINWYLQGGPQSTNPLLAGPYWEVNQGFNFAHGGAVVNSRNLWDSGYYGVEGFVPALQLDDQANHFRNASYFHRKGWFRWGWSNIFNASSGDYASISIGGNDYKNGVTNVEGMVRGTVDAMDDIADRGIRQFFILAVPDITLTPLIRKQLETGALSQSEFDAISDRIALHNSRLEVRLNDFSTDRDAEVYFVRADLLIADAFENPEIFGFTNVTDACLDVGLVLNDCPDTYAFYDPFHPTRRGQQFIAELAIQTMLDAKQGRVSGFSRTSALGEQALVGNQLLSSRFAAFSNGDRPQGLSFDSGNLGLAVNSQLSGIGFHESGIAIGEGKYLSFYRYVDGQAPGYYNYTPADEPQSKMEGNSLDFSDGEWITSYGADISLSDTLMIGALAIQSEKTDNLFATNRRNSVESISVYGAKKTGTLLTGVSVQSQTANQLTYRQPTASFIGSIQSDTSSRADTVRIDNSYALPTQNYAAAIKTKIAYARHEHDGYVSRSARGLIQNTIPSETNEAAVAYLGGELSKSLRIGQQMRTSFSVEAGMLATSSSDIGFTPVLDDTLAVNPDIDPIGFADPVAKLSDSGMYTKVKADFFASERFALSGEFGALSTERGSQQISRVKASLKF